MIEKKYKNKKIKVKNKKNLHVQMQFWCSFLSLQSWRWCLRCCSVVVSSKGKNKISQNHTKQTNKKPRSVPSSNAIQFQ
jgi:hypothetical protein